MVIFVGRHVSSCDTNAQGDVIYDLISQAMKGDSPAVVDFSGMTNATSSFVNSAFVPLLRKYAFSKIRARLIVRGAHPQIASMIRSRLTFESDRCAA